MTHQQIDDLTHDLSTILAILLSHEHRPYIQHAAARTIATNKTTQELTSYIRPFLLQHPSTTPQPYEDLPK